MKQPHETPPVPSATPTPWSRVPLGVVLVCVALTCSAWLPTQWVHNPERQLAVWVGDSFTGNYRFEPGERLQDLLGAEMGAEWTVVNHARPGARTLDIFMQVDQARLFHGEPDAVILPLQVSKLMPWESPVRMDKRGDNLKWWDVDLSSPLWTSFNEEYRRKVLIHKLGLLAGFLDGIEYLYVEHVQNPLEREQMRKDAPKRQERIAKKIVAIGEHWDQTPVDPVAMGESQAARDLAALKTHLDRLGIPLLVLIVPAGNPEASKAFTSAARQHLEDARMATRNWCDSQGIPWRDVVEELPGEAYDDFAHLRGVEGNRVLSRHARGWLAALPASP